MEAEILIPLCDLNVFTNDLAIAVKKLLCHGDFAALTGGTSPRLEYLVRFPSRPVENLRALHACLVDRPHASEKADGLASRKAQTAKASKCKRPSEKTSPLAFSPEPWLLTHPVDSGFSVPLSRIFHRVTPKIQGAFTSDITDTKLGSLHSSEGKWFTRHWHTDVCTNHASAHVLANVFSKASTVGIN